jgi:hypothetical protein
MGDGMTTALHPLTDGLHLGRHRRTVVFLLFALGLMAAIAGPMAARAGAEVSGGCTASLKGQDVAPLSSSNPSQAIDVTAKEQLVAASTSSAPITGYKVQLELGGFRWTVAKGAASGNSWQRAVSVEDYASHGAGLYKVIGSSTGPGACSGAVLVNLKGKSPLTTTAGIVGAAMTGLGGLGLVASAIRSVPKGTRRPLALVGLLFLPVMMVGMGGSAEAPPRAALDGEGRAGWRPRLSVLSVLSGVLAGVGVVILLQQYAVAYPTRGLALTGILGGAVLGLLATNVPSLLVRGRTESPVLTEDVTEDLALDTTEPAWAPTHAIPVSGLAAWTEPDDSSGIPVDKLDPGLEVRLLEQTGTWAHILCSNGWSAWVDSPQLVELSQ